MLTSIDKNHTPMIKQYLEIKQNYQDMFLFYRMGDFYELFFDDAIKASKLLSIALTSRNNDIPMAGVPFHSSASYIGKLINSGNKVAICEQISEPQKKGLVERKVLQVITPGTLTDINLLDGKTNNFILSIFKKSNKVGLAWLSLSSGDFYVKETSIEKIEDEIFRISPSEIISEKNLNVYLNNLDIGIKLYESFEFNYKDSLIQLESFFDINYLNSLGLNNKIYVNCCGPLLRYITSTQNDKIHHLKKPKLFNDSNHIFIDKTSITGLEIFKTNENKNNPTLFSLLDQCNTSMGSRLLKKDLRSPYTNKKFLELRLNIVECLISDSLENDTNQISEQLQKISDIERLSSRLALRSIRPKEIINLKDSIISVINLGKIWNIIDCTEIKSLNLVVSDDTRMTKYIEAAIMNEPATSINNGHVIQSGFNKELDDLRNIKNNIDELISNLLNREKKRLGYSNVKIEYNKIHGFYLEVPRSLKLDLPEDYSARQTLKNSQRYIFPELKEIEDKVNLASDKALKKEKIIFEGVLDHLNNFVKDIQYLSDQISQIDLLVNFANIAKINNYTKPIFNNEPIIDLESSRHPVIEKKVENFVNNDLLIHQDANMIIITGPNMGGKSTYMRQIAINTIMASVGSYVPAKKMLLGHIDQILTRIGASDNLSEGLSTFMVEMNECAKIINCATENSLVIMDEVGRGTSSSDGEALAYSIARYISKNIKCLTLFATHYLRVAELSVKNNKIKNKYTKAIEYDGGITFLYKMINGIAPKSYGIQVAELSGLPSEIITNAKKLVQNKLINSGESLPDEKFNENELNYNRLKNKIEEIEIDKTTPIEALLIIKQLKKIIKD